MTREPPAPASGREARVSTLQMRGLPREGRRTEQAWGDRRGHARRAGGCSRGLRSDLTHGGRAPQAFAHHVSRQGTAAGGDLGLQAWRRPRSPPQSGGVTA